MVLGTCLSQAKDEPPEGRGSVGAGACPGSQTPGARLGHKGNGPAPLSGAELGQAAGSGTLSLAPFHRSLSSSSAPQAG